MVIGRQDYFILGAAFLSFLFSVSLWLGAIGSSDHEAGIFVGIWVPSILATGTDHLRGVPATESA